MKCDYGVIEVMKRGGEREGGREVLSFVLLISTQSQDRDGKVKFSILIGNNPKLPLLLSSLLTFN